MQAEGVLQQTGERGGQELRQHGCGSLPRINYGHSAVRRTQGDRNAQEGAAIAAPAAAVWFRV